MQDSCVHGVSNWITAQYSRMLTESGEGSKGGERLALTTVQCTLVVISNNIPVF